MKILLVLFLVLGWVTTVYALGYMIWRADRKGGWVEFPSVFIAIVGICALTTATLFGILAVLIS